MTHINKMIIFTGSKSELEEMTEQEYKLAKRNTPLSAWTFGSLENAYLALKEKAAAKGYDAVVDVTHSSSQSNIPDKYSVSGQPVYKTNNNQN